MTDTTPVDQPAIDVDTVNPDPDAATSARSQAFSASTEETSTESQIEEEGEIAADYIEEFLDICDIDGDIDIETRPGRAFVSVNSDGKGNLNLLSKPETVNALQELTRLAVQTKNGQFSRLILDIGGSREAREQELSVLVDRAILRIENGSAAAALPPMTSYERKIVHDLVASRGYTSASEGIGSDRHTVITTGS
jgi:spoIIIJ-associated protein